MAVIYQECSKQLPQLSIPEKHPRTPKLKKKKNLKTTVNYPFSKYWAALGVRQCIKRGIRPQTKLILKIFLKRKMIEISSGPKRPGRHGEKAEKRPKSFATAPVNEGGKAVFGQAPAFRGLPVEDGAPSPLGKSRGGAGAQQRGQGVQNRNIVTGPVRAGGEEVQAPEPRAWRAHERPPQPSWRAHPPRPRPGHSRFCSAKGRCDVAKARKDSFPMSQSSSPGTWPWRLAQKSTCCSFRSTVRRGGPASTGWESRERLRLRPGRHVLKSPGADWLEWSPLRCASFDTLDLSGLHWAPPQPRLFHNPSRFHFGVWGPWGFRREGSQALFPLYIYPKLFFYLVNQSTNQEWSCDGISSYFLEVWRISWFIQDRICKCKVEMELNGGFYYFMSFFWNGDS